MRKTRRLRGTSSLSPRTRHMCVLHVGNNKQQKIPAMSLVFRSFAHRPPLIHVRHLSSAISKNATTVLGIETSCDDTSAAIVDLQGNILSEVTSSQLKEHLLNGGVIPTIAKNLHINKIDRVIVDCLKQAGMRMSDIDYIAVTNRPGLPLSLQVGVDFAKKLAIKYNKPLIPIHHMEAHALIGMLSHPGLEFPFLCLLLSGGHAQIALVMDVDHFYLLGETIDSAPGELFDKVARRLKLRNLGEFYSSFTQSPNSTRTLSTTGSPFDEISGGEAIEVIAKRGDALKFFNKQTFIPLSTVKSCDFSFCGFKSVVKLISNLEEQQDLEPDALLPETADLAASLQYTVVFHVLKRLARAVTFVERTRICELPHKEINKETLMSRMRDATMLQTEIRQLNLPILLSGGVACNEYFAECLTRFCLTHVPYRSNTKLQAVIPRPRKLCSDNGIMIAWNAVLKLRRLYREPDNGDSIGETEEPKAAVAKSPNDQIWLLETRHEIESLVQDSRARLGISLRDAVAEANISPTRIHKSVFFPDACKRLAEKSVEHENAIMASKG